jgi:aspartate kinase
MLATSEVSISLTVGSAHDLSEIKKDISRIASMEIKEEKAIVTIIGDVSCSSAILARTFKVCERLGVQVQMISQGASKVNISFIVESTEAADIVKGLHVEFFDSDPT